MPAARASLVAFALTAAFALTTGAATAPAATATKRVAPVHPSVGHPVVGLASGAGPLRGARVEILDLTGRVIARPRAATDMNGGFYLRVRKHLPRTFLVRTTGGRDNTGVVRGHLLSRQGFYKRHQVLVVNPATTLAAAYQERHPKLSTAKAEAKIARFLGLPARVNLHADLEMSNIEFHGATYMKAAKRYPLRYSRLLVKSIDAGRRKEFEHPVRSQPAAVKAAAAAARGRAVWGIEDQTFIAGTSKLAAYASGSPAGGAIFGQVVGKLLGIESAPESPELSKLREIDTKLDKVQQDISYMIGEQHEARIEADYNAYESSVNGFSSLQATANQAWLSYTTSIRARVAAQSSPMVTKFRMAPDYSAADIARENFLGYYASYYEGDLIKGMEEVADKFTTGGAGGSNPFVLWDRATKEQYRFVTPATQDRFAAAYTYWRALEARLLVMNVEYARTEQGAAEAGKVASWVRQYARQGTNGVNEGTALTGWDTASGLKQMTRLAADEVYDIGTGIVWQNAARVGKPVDLVSLPRGTGWSLPTLEETDGIMARNGGYLSWQEQGFTTPRDYMIAQGFGSFLSTWRLLSTSTESSRSEDGTGILYKNTRVDGGSTFPAGQYADLTTLMRRNLPVGESAAPK
ncbi:MAG: hypothetical protein JWM25_571 [Thermoleophilia bacterium]|nr:hypothetical protein [Thermoleophilia bacterium]